MKKPFSLQRRITAGLAISLAILFSVQWWLASRGARRVVENKIASNLDHQVDNLLAAANFGPGGVFYLAPGSEDRVYRRVFSGHYYVVRSDAAEVRSRSLWDAELPQLPEGLFRATGPRGQALLVKTATFTKQGKKITIAVAEDVADIDAEIASFRNLYAAVAAATLVILLLIQAAIVRMALAPVNRAREDAVRLEKGEAEKISADVPLELAPFVAQINRLTDITRKRLARSRNALGGLAHSLKTHLTVLVQAADGADAQDGPALKKILDETTATMQRLMDRELKKARLAGSHAPGKRFSPRQDVPPLLSTLALLYRDKGLAVESSLTEENFPECDTEDMVELLGVLLDNSHKWAKSRVRLSVAADKGLTVEIEDDGPGCPPEQMVSLTGRGTRLDESLPGYGLGLAIARDIVESYSGTMVFSRSEPLGGLRTVVNLPQ